MTGKLSKNFHGVGIGPLSKILAVNSKIFIGVILCRAAAYYLIILVSTSWLLSAILVGQSLMIGQLILLHTRPRAFMLNLPLCKKGQLISNHA